MIKKMIAFAQKFRSKVQKPKMWLLIIYLIFAAYLVVDGSIYLLGSYSGRISILDCTAKIENRTICTVTLYGIRETHQSHFWAEDFRSASEVANFDLGASDKATYGIEIMITDRFKRINFVAPYQSSVRARRATERINQMFSDRENHPSGRFIYIGFDTSLYRRAILLVVGFLFVLTYHRHWQAILSNKNLPRVMKLAIEKGNFRDYAFSWWRFNFLFRIIFLFLLFIISGAWSYSTQHGDFINASCYSVLVNCEICSKFPISSFICLYPLIAYGTIQALIQWKLLSSKIKVSGLWVAAPVIASLTLIPLMTSSTCENCREIKSLVAGLLQDENLLIGLTVYCLLTAFIQWIAMRRSLSFSLSWILILPINTVLISGLRFLALFTAYMQFHSAALRILLLLLWPLSLMLDDIIPAIYMSSLIYRKNSGEISSRYS